MPTVTDTTTGRAAAMGLYVVTTIVPDITSLVPTLALAKDRTAANASRKPLRIGCQEESATQIRIVDTAVTAIAINIVSSTANIIAITTSAAWAMLTVTHITITRVAVRV